MTAFNLSGFLPYQLSILSNRISNAISRTYQARFGLTVPQWRVMAVLGEFDAMTARDIARATEMDKVSVSRAVARLRERGLVAAEAASRDGRSRILRLSSTGRDIFEEVVPVAKAYEAALLDGLSRTEIDSLNALIAKLAARVEQVSAEADSPADA